MAVTGAQLHSFITYRRQDGERVYAVVDAARDRELAFAARDRFKQPIRWLFGKRTTQKMTDFAPYLVSMTVHSRYPYAGSGYLDMWAQRLGKSAGILLLSGADESALWKHLCDVFRVEDETDKKFYFRFYDPRVLCKFLPTCTAAEVQELFGPIRLILAESENAGRLRVCRPGHRGAMMSEFRVTDQRDPQAARR